MKVKSFLIFMIIAIVSSLSIGFSQTKGSKVVIKGSTTVLPIAQKALEAFYAKTKIVISLSGTGSGDGIKSIIDGSCDIANSSREMKKGEWDLAKAKGEKIKEVAIAYDMIVPVVHPSNPVSKLTIDQLKAIYVGEITNWSQVGGKNEKIVVISRDSSSGTFEVWESKVMKKAEVRKDALLQASNGAVLSVVANNKRAIGYLGYGYLDKSVKAIVVNNVKPTIPNGKSGAYPIARKLYMYVNESKLKPEAKKYIDFILSKEGQKIVKEAGFIPLTD